MNNLAQNFDQAFADLDLATGASYAEVKASYHRLAKALHPDLNPGASGRLMGRVNQAYNLLTSHFQGSPAARVHAKAGTVRRYAWQEFKEPGAQDACAGKKAPRKSRRNQPRCASASSPSTRPQARSRREEVTPGPVPLLRDEASGWRLKAVRRDEAGGLVYQVEISGRPLRLTLPVRCRRACPDCGGSGRHHSSGESRPCPGCRGRGTITRADQVSVAPPLNAAPGMSFSIPSGGSSCPIRVELTSSGG